MGASRRSFAASARAFYCQRPWKTAGTAVTAASDRYESEHFPLIQEKNRAGAELR